MNKKCENCENDGYRNPAVAVDAVALREVDSIIEALMIKRGSDPQIWEGKWAFPGGFVDYGEDPKDAVIRELMEETGVSGSNPIILDIHGDPERDPRKHVIGLFYLVKVDPREVPVAGDDAEEAAWIRISDLGPENVAGSHIEIIEALID